VTIVASGDIAAAHMLIRTSGTLRTGQDVGSGCAPPISAGGDQIRNG
jgi:hypothetical protein